MDRTSDPAAEGFSNATEGDSRSLDEEVVVEAADALSIEPVVSQSSKPSSPAVSSVDVPAPANLDEPELDGHVEDRIELEEPVIIDPEASIDELRSKAVELQTLLKTELDEVRTMKTNCTKLKQENKSLQEYIESLMARR